MQLCRHLELSLVEYCPGPPKPRMMQRKKPEPQQPASIPMSSTSRAGHHRADETRYGHQAGKRIVSRGRGPVSPWTIKDSKTPRKSNFPNDHCKRGGETDHHSGLQSDPK